MSSARPIVGVIIAGGKSLRMGEHEKCLLSLNNTSILSEIIKRLNPQVDEILINANGDPSRFDFTGLPVIKDAIEGQQGPLVGIYTAMLWVKENISKNALIVCVPSDAPFIPANMVEKLKAVYQKQNAKIACISANEHLHPVFNLMPVSLHEDLYKTLKQTNTRAIYKWFKGHRLATVEYPTHNNPNYFFNINTPQDLKTAKALIEQQ